MSELDVAWPPMPASSTTSTLNPSDAPYTAAERPAGPAPTMMRSNSMLPGLTGDPDARARSALVGSFRMVPSGKTTSGNCRLVARALDQCPTVVRIGEQERVRHRAPSEGLPQLEGAPRPRFTDDEHRVRRRALRIGPVEEHPGDRVVEQLVGRRRRPEHVVVDATLGDRIEDRLARRGVAPLPPPDQETALGVRVEPARLVEQVAARHARQPLRGQDQRDVVTRRGDLLEPFPCVSSGERTHTTW